MHREKRGTKSESPSEHSFSDLAEALDKQKAMTELVGHHAKIELPGNKMSQRSELMAKQPPAELSADYHPHPCPPELTTGCSEDSRKQVTANSSQQ
jgi:hypothetical protein